MTANETKKQIWAAEYARRVEHEFERWQEPLGIDDQYREYLANEMLGYYENPLLKSLIESLC
jgi:hypothetical protein